MGPLLEDLDALIEWEHFCETENYIESWEQFDHPEYMVDDIKEVLYSTLQEDWSLEFEKSKEKAK